METSGRTYKLNDIAKAIDREKTTLIRWEKEGLIPQSHRDEKGWRYFTEEEYQKILEIAKSIKENFKKNPSQPVSRLMPTEESSAGNLFIPVNYSRVKKISRRIIHRALQSERIRDQIIDTLLKLFFQPQALKK